MGQFLAVIVAIWRVMRTRFGFGGRLDLGSSARSTCCANIRDRNLGQ